MLQDYVERIENSRVYSAANETPLQAVSILSRRLGNRVFLKREDLQPVFSFKLRGAYNKMAGLSANAKERGVIAASAGNHAQGIALAAKRLDMQALIVMPQTTPQIKLESVRALGAAIELKGSNYDEAFEFAQHKAEELGSTFIHPYDDQEVIAGQGTIAMEILRRMPGQLDAIFVPVGGGGLIAGMAAYVKALRPDVRVVGVEPRHAACMSRAIAAGERVVLDDVDPFADGVAVRQVGEEPFRIARKCVDEVVTVTHREICTAIKEIFDDSRCIAEPAGALALAGLKRCVAREEWTGKVLVAVVSGANVDFDRLRGIAELADLVDRREALLGVTIPERPGSFRAFCRAIGQRSITEFNYRYADADEAHVFVGVELRNGRSDKEELIADLTNRRYKVVDLTDNEMARIHVRYMVGGRAAGLRDERLFRFDLPEQPGALLRYLTRMGKRWNISLFHYRSHGAAYGRVLAGIQVPESELEQFHAFLSELNYPFHEETGNSAYELFLGADR
ncbi:MAG: threonine ammonia-lyase, biosynthetic [Gammaproteobacteria bacterium]|nr:threonine ammonia-lyase, biosynthetic [Gammaproteobacteria bacterium]